jgi:hypothetical protein
MNKIFAAGVLTIGIAAAHAEAESESLWKRNRISVSFKAVFNIDAEFVDPGSTFSLSDPGPDTGSVEERTYDNGFNRVDITGNNHGGVIGTWYWDYSDPSQISGGNLVVESTSASTSGSSTATDEPYLGFEITYNRELGAKGRVHYGIEGAFGFFNVSITDTDPLPGTTTVVTDSFSLDGQIPAAPPTGYTFEGPHQVISSTPVRTVNTTAGTGVAGTRTVDSDVYGFRLGPYMDVDLGKDWYLTFSGGLAFAAVDSDFKLFESVSLPSGDALRAGNDGSTDWVFGGFVSGSLGYSITENLGLFVGGQYEALGDVQENIGGKQMILHLGGAVSGLAGISVSF